MEDEKELQTPQEETVEAPTPQDDGVKISQETLDKLTAKLDSIEKQLELQKKIQKQLENISNNKVSAAAPVEQPHGIQKQLSETSYYSDYNMSSTLPVDPTISGVQYGLGYLQDLEDQGATLEQMKQSALTMMNAMLPLVKK